MKHILTGYILTYSPFVNYDGTDTFTYKANDGESDSNIASVTIDIENTIYLPKVRVHHIMFLIIGDHTLSF